MKKLLAVLALLSGLAVSKANATIVFVSSATTSQETVLISTPATSGFVNVLKSCIVTSSGTVGAATSNCFNIQFADATHNGYTTVLKLCALAGTSQSTPNMPQAVPGSQGQFGLSSFFGENLKTAGAIGVIADVTQGGETMACSVAVVPGS